MSKANTNQRISFSSVKINWTYPDFLEVQLKSFMSFSNWKPLLRTGKNEGLYQVFQENFPISDTRNNFVLEFLDYYIDPPTIFH
jgi:DNA-directed RNA polymerase subunit beta